VVPGVNIERAAAPGRDDDLVQPFQIEAHAIRGRLVRLGPLVNQVLSRHAYPEPVAALLGQLLALAATIAGTFKYDGVFTLQIKGDGPVNLLVADVTSAGDVRGYARYDAGRIAAADDGAPGTSERPPGAPGPAVLGVVPRLIGTGYLAFTVDQGRETERYQGIVELVGAELADCIHHYFRQSEQLEAGVKLAVGRVPGGISGGITGGERPWRAAGLMVQRLPLEGGDAAEAPTAAARDAQEDGWRRSLILMGSATTEEMLDPALGAHDLLYRLFHEDGVRVFRQRPLKAGCRCSEERVVRVLRALKPDELEEMKIDGRITVTCQFCMREYAFDETELAAALGP
jgi:molecular chaperone Hsp33